MAILLNTAITGTNGELLLPRGSTSERPSSPQTGMVRFNTDIDLIEIYDGSKWIAQDGTTVQGFSAAVSGEFFTDYFNGYVVHAFTGAGTFTPAFTGNVDVLIVAGGGGGGSHVPGGGGAGGLIYRPNLSVNPTTYNIVVGQGGQGSQNVGGYAGMPNATRGGDSSAFGLTALGGGFGGSWTQDTRSNNGGSGGGRNTNRNSGQRLGLQPSQSGDSGEFGFGNDGGLTTSQSNSPYPGSGGGGAGTPGQNGLGNRISGDGGAGRYYGDKFGTRWGEQGWFAGGGGGGAWGNLGRDNPSSRGRGGIGGGGDGDSPQAESGPYKSFKANQSYSSTNAPLGGDRTLGENGMPHTGGGGGGAGATGGEDSFGGNGGSGIVLIRYLQ